MKNKSSVVASVLAFSLIFGLAQEAGRGPMPKSLGIEDHDYFPENPREYRNGEFMDFPDWRADANQPNDVFTFARLRYPTVYDNSGYSFSRRRGGRSTWTTDYPEGDINLSFRLQQLTSMKVNPNPVIVDINPEQMRHYPLIYMLEVGHIGLNDEQALTMRNYMLNGGFIWVDDFWGTDAWDTFEQALKQIWPDRQWVELEIDHDIFHCVFELKVKPQIPHIRYKEAVMRGITWEFDKPGSETVHYRAIYDDKKRLCMLICWNTDTSEGWEQEGSDPWYFTEFSEKYAYPLGINIVFYALTH